MSISLHNSDFCYHILNRTLKTGVKLSQAYKIMSQVKVITAEKKDDYVSYGAVELKGLELMEGENLLSYSFLLDSFRKIMGRTLTMLDASIVDKHQNKAMKDIVRGIFSDEMEFSADLVYDQQVMAKLVEEHTKDIKDLNELGSYSIEECLGVEKVK